MSEIQEILLELTTFRDVREWKQFHNTKDLAIALSIESGELLELFLWKSADDVDEEKLKDELAGVFAYAFLLAEKYSFDVKRIVLDKIQKNQKKYPIDKSLNSAKKYDEL